ncbi:hypothetical protein H072_1218 [Dactylellina haptotyla CBS 200.50]|uniref:Uncharacterized protein n=1 Tax=Dactylellina haptotyla (strain CBS 200.50) TaxID=1284197 RepID=S8CAR1_DACHA|nr:hypothetical protein H072_1218 [Dactylellina haptotyla CBS 200.50]
MVGFDYLRRLAVRSLALQSRAHKSTESKYLPGSLENTDYLLSVGTYGGDIVILKYNPYLETLTKVSTYHETNLQASWQTIHPQNKDIIYSVDEGNPGGIVSFRLDRDSASLKKLVRSDGINGTVSITIKDELLVTASYLGYSVQTFETDDKGGLSKVVDSFTYSLTQPGLNKERQEAAHPHQVVIDPSGSYIVTPDLGADLLRLYSINETNISELKPVPVEPGSGPRHGQFMDIKFSQYYFAPKRLFYLVNELRNTIAVYHTHDWKNGTIEFIKTQELDTLPGGKASWQDMTPPPNAAEITISKDKRFLYVSNRNDQRFKDRKFGPSDSIALYKIDPDRGEIAFVKLLEAGGIMPRHFSFHESGQIVAVALQESDKVVIFRVDPTTGEFIGADTHDISVHVPHNPVCVTWL